MNALSICLNAFWITKLKGFITIVTSLCSEEDGLPGSFILDVGGEAFEELGILSLGHGSEDRGWSPASWVYCSNTEENDQQTVLIGQIEYTDSGLGRPLVTVRLHLLQMNSHDLPALLNNEVASFFSTALQSPSLLEVMGGEKLRKWKLTVQGQEHTDGLAVQRPLSR